MIKKRGFWRNALLNPLRTLPMLTYLNRMSAKGYHITSSGRFKNTFDENKHIRYLYAICNTRTEDYYSEVESWEKVFEYKNLSFFRKKLPKDYVGVKKRGLQKKAMKEKLWLDDMLKNGFLLFGKAEDEYIFQRSSETGKTEYFIDYVSKSKSPDEYLYEKALDGLECLSPSTDGITYYFIKREGKEVVTGLKKLRSDAALMKRKMLWSLFGLFLTLAASTTSLVFAIKYRTAVIPCLIAGGTLTAVSFIIFAIFKALFKREKRRLEEEEKSLEALKSSGKTDEQTDSGSGAATQPPGVQNQQGAPNGFNAAMQVPAVPGFQFNGATQPQNGVPVQQYGGQAPMQNGAQIPVAPGFQFNGTAQPQNGVPVQQYGGQAPMQNGAQIPVAPGFQFNGAQPQNGVPVQQYSGQAPMQNGVPVQQYSGQAPMQNGAQIPAAPGFQFNGATQPQNGVTIQQYGGQAPMQNGAQISATPGFQFNGGQTQNTFAAPPQSEFSATGQSYHPSDESEWQYVDEDEEDSESENGFDENGGVTYSPNGQGYKYKPSENAYGQQQRSAPVHQVPNTAEWSTSYYGQNNARQNENHSGGDTVSSLRTADGADYSISYSETEHKRRKFLFFQLIGSLAFMLLYIAGSALAILQYVVRFVLTKQGNTALLIVSIFLAVFTPVVLYFGIGSAHSLVKDIKNRNKSDF